MAEAHSSPELFCFLSQSPTKDLSQPLPLVQSRQYCPVVAWVKYGYVCDTLSPQENTQHPPISALITAPFSTTWRNPELWVQRFGGPLHFRCLFGDPSHPGSSDSTLPWAPPEIQTPPGNTRPAPFLQPWPHCGAITLIVHIDTWLLPTFAGI